MLPTYDAVIDGDRIEWPGDGVGPFPRGVKVPIKVMPVTVTSLPAESEAERWVRAVAALKAIAALPSEARGLPADPIEWQREIRKDRPLPGREA